MKNLILGLVGCLAFSGLAKSDVVAFYNTSTKDGTANIDIRLTFTANVNGSGLTGFKLFATDSSIDSTQLTALFSGDGNVGSKTITSSTRSGGAFYFDLSDSTGWGSGKTGFQNLTGGQGYLMQLTSITGNGTNTNLYDTTTSATITSNTASGFSGAAYFAGSSNARFEVYTVPEPGTLILGTLAACSGGAGVWWKRRKRKATQPEATDQPATA